MLPSICRHTCRRGLFKAHISRTTAALSTQRATPKSRVSDLGSHLIRRASTLPKKPYLPKKSTQPTGKPPLLSKIIIYHLGQPRIYMLGGLKVTALMVFGFFLAVVLPTYVEPEAEQWKAPLIVLASTLPVIAIWYLTYPMVIWIHIHVPKEIQQNKVLLERFLTKPSADTAVYITTMGPLGKPRVTHVKLADLKPVKQRLGLVNYIRDTTQENMQRKFYHFRAIGKFMINDPEPRRSSGGSRQKQTPWLWYALIKGFRQHHGTPNH